METGYFLFVFCCYFLDSKRKFCVWLIFFFRPMFTLIKCCRKCGKKQHLKQCVADTSCIYTICNDCSDVKDECSSCEMFICYRHQEQCKMCKKMICSTCVRICSTRTIPCELSKIWHCTHCCTQAWFREFCMKRLQE